MSLTFLGCRYCTNLNYGLCKKLTELQQRANEWIARPGEVVAPRVIKELRLQGTTMPSQQVLSTDPTPFYVKRTKNPFTTGTQNRQTGVLRKIPHLG